MKHFKVYISTQHLWINVRWELKAVIEVLLDTVQTRYQYVELILQTAEMIWEK